MYEYPDLALVFDFWGRFGNGTRLGRGKRPEKGLRLFFLFMKPSHTHSVSVLFAALFRSFDTNPSFVYCHSHTLIKEPHLIAQDMFVFSLI